MSFNGVTVGNSATNTLTVQNQGNALMTITGLTGSGGINAVITATPNTFTVNPGSKQDVVVRFTPTAVASYSGTISVNGDQTSGPNTITFSGSGTLDGIPIFSKSGHGDTFFTLPSYVTKLHVHGHFVNVGGNSNFIADANGSNFINEILRNADYDADKIVPAGATIVISSSGSIDWTFTELR